MQQKRANGCTDAQPVFPTGNPEVRIDGWPVPNLEAKVTS